MNPYVNGNQRYPRLLGCLTWGMTKPENLHAMLCHGEEWIAGIIVCYDIIQLGINQAKQDFIKEKTQINQTETVLLHKAEELCQANGAGLKEGCKVGDNALFWFVPNVVKLFHQKNYSMFIIEQKLHCHPMQVTHGIFNVLFLPCCWLLSHDAIPNK